LEVNMSSDFRFQDIFVRGVQDPYPFYHWLRTEAPVYWNAEIVPAWFISRYDDVVAVTEDDRRFGSREGIESAVQQERDGCFWHTQAAGALFIDDDWTWRPKHVPPNRPRRRRTSPVTVLWLGNRRLCWQSKLAPLG
jgi:cytochrome P450